MKDLTQGSIAGHLVSMAAPTAAGMVIQTLYYFVDLYFVGRIGDSAVAGVSAAGIIVIVILSLTQMLGVGTTTLIAHAIGRKDRNAANLIFNQSLSISGVCGALALVAGYVLSVPCLRLVAADATTVAQGRDYLYWILPGVALQFGIVSIASALRGAGIVRPVIAAYVVSLLINISLAPVLIAGWGTGHSMGAAGAGLASSISILACVVLLWIYCSRHEKYMSLYPEQWRPQLSVWKRVLGLGLPSGCELILSSASFAVTLWAISNFGSAAQAGLGIGTRIIQGIYLPALAIAAGVAPIAGQNFGGRHMDRVRETFRIASVQSAGVMLAAMLLCQWQPETMVRFFSHNVEVVRTGAAYLRVVSWTLVISAVVFVCSSMFQALGNTRPTLLSSASQLVAYCLPIMWLTSQREYTLEQVWYLLIASSLARTALTLALLWRQMRLHLASG
jgi:putative MATE family efflux protein